MSNRLSGKVCIITGTGGGMGREAALTFAREGALVVGCRTMLATSLAIIARRPLVWPGHVSRARVAEQWRGLAGRSHPLDTAKKTTTQVF
jgi:NAD(P)-dependent dehydrogenase (short-subunit alcohol dehydrogenase family)